MGIFKQSNINVLLRLATDGLKYRYNRSDKTYKQTFPNASFDTSQLPADNPKCFTDGYAAWNFTKSQVTAQVQQHKLENSKRNPKKK